MIKIDTAYIAKRIKLAIDKISCEVEPACRQALRDACEREENPTAKFALGVMNDNIDLAIAEHSLFRDRQRGDTSRQAIAGRY